MESPSIFAIGVTSCVLFVSYIIYCNFTKEKKIIPSEKKITSSDLRNLRLQKLGDLSKNGDTKTTTIQNAATDPFLVNKQNGDGKLVEVVRTNSNENKPVLKKYLSKRSEVITKRDDEEVATTGSKRTETALLEVKSESKHLPDLQLEDSENANNNLAPPVPVSNSSSFTEEVKLVTFKKSVGEVENRNEIPKKHPPKISSKKIQNRDHFEADQKPVLEDQTQNKHAANDEVVPLLLNTSADSEFGYQKRLSESAEDASSADGIQSSSPEKFHIETKSKSGSVPSKKPVVKDETITDVEIDQIILSKDSKQLTKWTKKENRFVENVFRLSSAWCRATELSLLDNWRDHFACELKNLVQGQVIEEDLFSDSSTDLLTPSLTHLLGYKAAYLGNGKFSVTASGNKANFPSEYLQLLLQVKPSAVADSIRSIFACCRDYPLDQFLSDYCEATLLASFSDNQQKNLTVALCVVMRYEVDRSLADSTLSMDRSSALFDLLGLSPIVPFLDLKWSAIPFSNGRPVNSQERLFESLPCFPVPTRIGCPAVMKAIQQINFVSDNLAAFQEKVAGILLKALKANRASVLQWATRLISLVNKQMSSLGRIRLVTERLAEPWNNGFILNLAAVLLILMRPFFSDRVKFVSNIDWEYVTTNQISDNFDLTNLLDGGKINRNRLNIDSEDVVKGEKSDCKRESKSFSFATELFWITSNMMELVDKVGVILIDFESEAIRLFSTAVQRYESAGKPKSLESELLQLRSCLHSYHYGLRASPLFAKQFLSLSCSWAMTASDWITAQLAIQEREERAAAMKCIPAGLVKAMCAVWKRAAFGDERVFCMSSGMACDATLFCLKLLKHPNMSNIIVQDRLVDLLTTFVTTSSEGPSKGDGSQFGARRGLGGEVLDNGLVRSELCPALLDLYSSCHAVAALDSNEDVHFNQFSVRARINTLLSQLYRHPLPEPRASILSYISNNSNGFQAFVIAMLDTITFDTYEALRWIAFDRQTPVPYRQKEENKQRCGNSLRGTSSTFKLLNLLCTNEELIRLQLHCPALIQRIALFLFTYFFRVFSVDVIADIKSEKYSDWGLKESDVVPQPVEFLLCCMDVPKDLQDNLLQTMAGLPDYDLEVFARVSNLSSGVALKRFVDAAANITAPGKVSVDDGTSISWDALIENTKLDKDTYVTSLQDIEQVLI